jgi:stress-induced morphogen
LIGNTRQAQRIAFMASRTSRIRDTLQAAFNPVILEIQDDSAKHAGHAERNDLADGETHYRVVMVSEAFSGMSRLERSRTVNAKLNAEFASGLHALSLSLGAPGEPTAG